MKKIKMIFAACFIMGVLFYCPRFSVKAMAYETAWFPAPQMNLSQIAYETGSGSSHGDYNAIDILPGGRVFAPFTGVVKQKDSRWGYVLFQSTDRVYYPDGTLDYMTVGFMHDENISDISVGQTIGQGTAFYDAGGQGKKSDGTYGHVYGNHVDISVFKGAVNSVTKYGRGNIYAYQAFSINRGRTTSIINKGKALAGHSTNNGAPTDWTNLWKDLQTDAEKPTISEVSVWNVSSTGYIVHCIVKDNNALSVVKFPTWTAKNGQDDITWHESRVGGTAWELNYQVNISDHNNEQNGWYHTDIYCYDAAGNLETYKTVSVYIDTVAPTLTNIKVTPDLTGYTVECDVSDNVGIDRVQFPTWTPWKDGQDDLVGDWQTSEKCRGKIVNGHVTYRVNRSDHNNELGAYVTDIYVYDTSGNVVTGRTGYSFEETPPVIKDVKVSKDNTGFEVTCKVSDETGVDKVSFFTWTAKNGQDDISKKDIKVDSGGGEEKKITYHVNQSDHNNEDGYYITHIYAYDKLGNCATDNAGILIGEKNEAVAIRSFNGHKYYLIDNSALIGWNDAKQYCKNVFGGYLVSITSKEENEFVTGLLKEFNYSTAFIGGSDREKEGEWKWESGESWSYSNWGANQPDDYKAYEGGQDYLRIGQDGAWDDFNSMADISGTEIKSFICETDINEFSINYHLNGGKNASDNPTTYIADNNIVFGNTAVSGSTLIKNPTKEHYIFKGWYTAENSGEKYESNKKYSGNLELYARWEAQKEQVTFNGNGGIISGSSTKEVVYGTAYGTLPTATRTGHTFLGWYTASENGKKVDSTTICQDTGMLYAHWKKSVYTVNLDANGGKTNAVSKTVTYDEAYGTFPDIERPGYTFKGWYTEKSGGNKVDAKSIVNVAKNHTLYAQWVPLSYELEFDANGGTIEGNAKQEGLYNTVYGKLPEAKKDGYTFLGWFTAKTGGSQITASTLCTGNLTVYAHWEKDASHVHSYTETITKKATCTTNGTKTFKCACGDVYEETIKATGHLHKETRNKKEATETTEGYTGDIYCKDCNTLLEKGKPIPKLEETVDKDAPIIQAESVQGYAGDEVTIPVTIKQNSGIAGFSYDVNYDSSKLQLKKMTAGTVTKEGTFTTNGNVVNWYTTDNITANGTILNITFTILKDTADGKYPVSISLHDGKKNLVNEEGSYVKAAYKAGEVEVVSGILGDINGDKDITIADVVLLNRYVLGKVSLDSDKKKLADMNSDGDVTIGDVVLLNRQVLGKDTPATVKLAPKKSRKKAAARASEEMKISVDNVSTKAGETISIPVRISNNQGIAGIAFSVELPEGYSLVSMKKGEVTSEGTFTVSENNCTWYTTDNIKTDGILLTLEVKAGENAKTGKIKVNVKDGKANNISDENGMTVPAVFTEGTVTIQEDSCAVNGHKGGKATCIKKAVCTVCGKEYGEVDPTNHEGETELRNVKKATCTEDGNTGDTYCKSCNTKIKEGTVIKAIGHKGGKATCIKKAVCTVCGKEYGEVDLKNHEGDTELRNYKWEDCTKGLDLGDRYCTSCGTLLVKGLSFPPRQSHEWMEGEVIKAPTATKTGIMQYECLYCPTVKRVVLGVLKLKTGEKITDKSTGAVYKVTGKNTVEYVKATSKKASRTISSTVKLKGIRCQVTSIAPKAFKGDTKIKTVVIPSTVRKIGKEAFAKCKNLKKITIKTAYLSSKKVGANAFKGIHAKAIIKVPKKQKKAYQKLLKARGIGKKVTVK